MSLSRLAMRIAAARAIKGATLAGDRVFDSAVDPINEKVAGQATPIVTVTTDDEETPIEGRDLWSGERDCQLVIEAAIATRVVVEGTVSLTIPETDEGMELSLDLIEHQVIAALTRERTDWSRVWMKFVPRITRRLSRRGASAENGVRFAARQLVLTCDLIDTPTDGAPIADGTAWADFLTVVAADEALQPIGAMLREVIEGQAVVDWQRMANLLGITREAATAIGIGPGVDGADAAAPVVEVNVDADRDPDMTITAAEAEAQGYSDGDP